MAPQVESVRILSSDQKELHTAGDGSRIVVKVSNIAALLEDATAKGKIILYLDGLLMTGIEAERTDRNTGEVWFRLRLADATRDGWTELLRRTRGFSVAVTASVGPLNGQAYASSAWIRFQRIPTRYFIGAVLFLAFSIVGFVLLARRSDLLRDLGPPPVVGRRSYSLARTQAAIWTFVIVGSFIFIWITTFSVVSVTGTAVVLMGLSSATVLTSAALDHSDQQKKLEETKKRQSEAPARLDELLKERNSLIPPGPAVGASPPLAEPGVAASVARLDAEIHTVKALLAAPVHPATAPVSDGFVRDILSDATGVSLHRFQMLLWTLVLAVVFAVEVGRNLAMPQFNDMLLVLTGISAGTYVGFKIPENKKPAA